MSRHLTLENRMGALIRQGYIGRNPHTIDFIHRLHHNHERMIRRDLDAALYPVETTASGFALIGCRHRQEPEYRSRPAALSAGHLP